MTPEPIARTETHSRLPERARWYAYAVITAGGLAFASSLARDLQIANPAIFVIYFTLATLASLMKMRLPGVDGTYSLNTIFILFGLYYLSPGETMLAGCAAVLVQSFWRAKQKPTAAQAVFNLANVSLSIATAFAVTHIAQVRQIDVFRPALLAAAAFVQFAVNTLIVSGILSLLQGKPVSGIWARWYEWSLPYYLIGVALVGLLPFQGRVAQPEAWMILLPLFYLVHFFYGLSISSKLPAGTANESPAGQPLPGHALLYVIAVLAGGAALFGWAAFSFDFSNLPRFVCFIALAMLASTWKVRLPGMEATISVGFVVTLFAITELPLSQALAIGAAAGTIQAFWKPAQRVSLLKTAFSVASLVLSAGVTHYVVRGSLLPDAWGRSVPATLAVATVLLFSVNTLMVAAAVCLAVPQPLFRTWRSCYFWSFPYYLVGACAAALMVATSRAAGWIPSVLILPLMGMVYLSYRQHVAKAVSTVRPR